MLEKDATIGNVKHEVLRRVAEYAFAGNYDDMEDKIPYEMISGPQANFRCCIYKEREIIRQRVRMAQGLNPTGDNNNNRNTIQIITAACEGCPITRFVVTDNCQKCMSKKCQQACNFGAITMLRDRAYIDPQICKECGKCAQACPYNAIADLMRPCKRSCPVDAITMDENNIVKIDEEKCIRCGQCIKNCPFGAIEDRAYIVDLIKELKSDKKVYAMVAPAGEGQFGQGVTMNALRAGLKEMGFTDMYEVALGGDLVAAYEAQEWAEAYKEGKKMTTSCCPAFVNMIKKHFPQLVDNMSTTISPMAAMARMVKAKEPDSVIIFFGPCIAKKSEVCNEREIVNADYAFTFQELQAMLDARKIDLTKFSEYDQQASIYGKRFANAGGVTAAVVEALKEYNESTDITVRQCNGADECKKALMLLKVGKMPEDFAEGMCCEGGCVNGPGSIKNAMESKKDREALLKQADSRNIIESINPYEDGSFSMHRH